MNSLIDLFHEIEGGVPRVATICGISARAVYKWAKRNRLPRTEFTNETSYAKKIEKATKGAVKASSLLQRTKHKPQTQH